jgi:hypothetical protein
MLAVDLPLAGNAPWCLVATPSMLDSFTPFRLSARERLRLLAHVVFVFVIKSAPF